MPDLTLFLVTLIPLFAFIVLDIGGSIEEEKAVAHETWRRVATISIMVVLYSVGASATFSEVSSFAQLGFLAGRALFVISPVSTLIFIALASRSFSYARDTMKREEAN